MEIDTGISGRFPKTTAVLAGEDVSVSGRLQSGSRVASMAVQERSGQECCKEKRYDNARNTPLHSALETHVKNRRDVPNETLLPSYGKSPLFWNSPPRQSAILPVRRQRSALFLQQCEDLLLVS